MTAPGAVAAWRRSGLVADLHVHSRFAIGCAKSLTLPALAAGARRAGVDLLATGDLTHPVWHAELREALEDTGRGVFRFGDVHFLLGTEVSCVGLDQGRVRRVHLLLLFPGWEEAEAFTAGLSHHARLPSDGRPITRLTVRQVTALALAAAPDALVIPAHAWTPWYGVMGAKAGYDDLAEAFGDLLPHVAAIESGLSSDPAMNLVVPVLGTVPVVSFSDAHSPAALGREVTILDAGLDWASVRAAILEGRFQTLELVPELGKYHWAGHRACGVRLDPAGVLAREGRCPVCGKPLTAGVADRIAALSGAMREVPGGGEFRLGAPLEAVLAAAEGVGPGSRRVGRQADALVAEAGDALAAAWDLDLDVIARVAGEQAALLAGRMREGRLVVEPGYDGKPGRIAGAT